MQFFKYPSIVRTKERKDIFKCKKVVATEKLHGTNFQLRIPRGITNIAQILYGSRDNDLGVADSNLARNFFNGAPVRWFTDRPELLENLIRTTERRNIQDAILYGEVCGTTVQGGVYYAARHEVFFRAFDLMVGTEFHSYDPFVEVCEESSMPRVPEIWRGEPTQAAFDALLEQLSEEARRNGVVEQHNISEGVIIRSDPLTKDRRSKWLLCKHKSAKFEEVVANGIRLEHLRLEPARHFAAMVVPQGRLFNVCGSLRANGVELLNDMPDLKYIAPAVVVDVQKECGDMWAALTAQGFTHDEIEKALRSEAGRAYRAIVQPNPEAA